MTSNYPTSFPAGAKTSVKPEDVFWVMKFEPRPDLPSGNTRPTEELEFEKEMGLAVLLMNDVIFLNQKIYVNCNDVFAWGCADCEEIRTDQIEELYRLWVEFPGYGPSLWCCLQRKEMPQSPVAKAMRNAGIDIDARIAAVKGKSNHYDGVSHVIADMKYRAYSQWARSEGKEPLPFDALWWNGWREFTQAVPGWYNDEWKKQEDAAIHQWRVDNGFVEEGNGQQQPPVQDPSPEPANPS